MVKVKTSIYADKDLWERFKSSVVSRGLEVSQVLEELMREEVPDELIEGVIEGLEGVDYEFDFEPVKPKRGLVSNIVRTMRDERTDSLS